MANYIPFSSAPMPTRPYGAMTGIAQADQDFMKQQAEVQSLEAMFMDKLRKQAELERYQGETPAKLAEAELARQRAHQTIPHLPELLMGEVGKARSARAKGDLEQATLPSDITAGVAKNEAATANAMQQRQMFMLHQLDSALPTLEMSGSPLQAQMAWDKVRQSMGQFGQQLPAEYTPQVGNQLKTLRQWLINSVTHQQKLGELRVQGDTARDVARIHGQSQKEVENIRQSGANWRSQLTADEKARVKKIEESVAALYNKIASGQTLTPQEDQAFRMGQQILMNLAATRGAAGPAMGYNFMGQNIPFQTPPPVSPGQPVPTAPRSYRNDAEAKAAGARGEFKPGDTIIINGQQFRVEQ